MVRVVIRPWPRSSLAGGDRGLRPGQRVERGEEPRLVLLAGEYEPGAAFVQVVRVRALRVESIGSDHRVGQIDSGGGEGVQQRGELGDLDDRMQQQRSSGGEKSVRGLLLLPSSVASPTATRRRSPDRPSVINPMR